MNTDLPTDTVPHPGAPPPSAARHRPPPPILGNLMTCQRDVAVLQRQVRALAALCLVFARRIVKLEAGRMSSLSFEILEEVLEIYERHSR